MDEEASRVGVWNFKKVWNLRAVVRARRRPAPQPCVLSCDDDVARRVVRMSLGCCNLDKL